MFKPYILSIGRLAEEKNYPFALEIFKEFSRSNPQYKYVIAGEGPLRAHLSGLSISMGISEKITFLGFVSNIYEWISESDAVLHVALTLSGP